MRLGDSSKHHWESMKSNGPDTALVNKVLLSSSYKSIAWKASSPRMAARREWQKCLKLSLEDVLWYEEKDLCHKPLIVLGFFVQRALKILKSGRFLLAKNGRALEKTKQIALTAGVLDFCQARITCRRSKKTSHHGVCIGLRVAVSACFSWTVDFNSQTNGQVSQYQTCASQCNAALETSL